MILHRSDPVQHVTRLPDTPLVQGVFSTSYVREPSLYLPIASPKTYGRASHLITAESRRLRTPLTPVPSRSLQLDYDDSYTSFQGGSPESIYDPWSVLRPKRSMVPHNTPTSNHMLFSGNDRLFLAASMSGLNPHPTYDRDDSLPLPRYEVVRPRLKEIIAHTGIGRPTPSPIPPVYRDERATPSKSFDSITRIPDLSDMRSCYSSLSPIGCYPPVPSPTQPEYDDEAADEAADFWSSSIRCIDDTSELFGDLESYSSNDIITGLAVSGERHSNVPVRDKPGE